MSSLLSCSVARPSTNCTQPAGGIGEGPLWIWTSKTTTPRRQWGFIDHRGSLGAWSLLGLESRPSGRRSRISTGKVVSECLCKCLNMCVDGFLLSGDRLTASVCTQRKAGQSAAAPNIRYFGNSHWSPSLCLPSSAAPFLSHSTSVPSLSHLLPLPLTFHP